MARRQGGTLSGFTPLSTPNAPTGLSVSTSIGSATVSFTAPTDTGDGAVTSFIVTAINESTGVSAGATGTESPITVSPGGGTFKIRAQAVNGFGPGRLTEFSTGNAIFSGAKLYAWGSNSQGQQGRNNTTTTNSPVQVGALETWETLSEGDAFHSHAIKTDGTLWAWGDNGNGQLGDGARVKKSSPVQIGALTTWSSAANDTNHSLLLRVDGALFSTGQNSNGQLGQNNLILRSSPVQVGAAVWAKVAAGESHSVAIRTNGTLWAWGKNNFGQCGDSTNTYRSSPVQVGALSTWYTIGAGNGRTFAIKSDNTLWAMGTMTWGALGNGFGAGNVNSPIQIGALSNWSIVGTGDDGSGAVKTDGTLWTWGRNERGQCGDNTDINRSSPVQLGALTTWGQISVGSLQRHAIKTDGTLWGWGYSTGSGFNPYLSAVGDSTRYSRSSPVQLGALTNWVAVSSKNSHGLALEGVL